MKTWGRWLVIWAVLGLVGWGTSYYLGTHRQPAGGLAELDWLKQEFHLTDGQLAEVKTLRDQYAPVCSELCAEVMESQEKTEQLLLQHDSVTPDLTQALAEESALKQKCQLAMLAHIYRVAEIMPPRERPRYLALVARQVVVPGCSMNHCTVH